MSKRIKIRHTYAIGDIQGCHREFLLLLERLEFDPAQDQLWLTGDLVSRGPKSLEVLRYVKSLGDAAITVLGNHDLHLLAAAAGIRGGKLDHSLDAVMQAPDRDELLEWLQQQPLIHRATRPAWPHEWVLVHAGLAPQWTVNQAEALAIEVQDILRSGSADEYFRHMYGNLPDSWHDRLSGMERLRFITNCMTRMRFCTPEGALLLEEKGSPHSSETGLPWFNLPGRRNSEAGILFGHWSTLGQVVWSTARVYGLDGGALWGGNLIALRLEDMQLTFLPCEGYRTPG